MHTTKEWMSCVVFLQSSSRKFRAVNSPAPLRCRRILPRHALALNRTGSLPVRRCTTSWLPVPLRCPASLNASSNQPEEERSRSSSFQFRWPSMPEAGSRSLAWCYVLAGVVATIVAGGLIALGEAFQVAGAKPLAETSIAILLFMFFPEKNVASWTVKRVAALFSIGLCLALFWVFAFAWGRTKFPDLPEGSELAIAVGLISSIVTAPIFEEKVVRHLLLRGGAALSNHWISAFLVSLVFALVHKDAILWSFLVSLVLCWLALEKGIGTLQRALVHSIINALVMTWYFSGGFGFFT